MANIRSALDSISVAQSVISYHLPSFSSFSYWMPATSSLFEPQPDDFGGSCRELFGVVHDHLLILNAADNRKQRPARQANRRGRVGKQFAEFVHEIRQREPAGERSNRRRVRHLQCPECVGRFCLNPCLRHDQLRRVNVEPIQFVHNISNQVVRSDVHAISGLVFDSLPQRQELRRKVFDRPEVCLLLRPLVRHPQLLRFLVAEVLLDFLLKRRDVILIALVRHDGEHVDPLIRSRCPS